MKVVILDYGIGNLKSIYNALNTLQHNELVISRDFEIIKQSDVMILPGVGSFKHAMEQLENYQLIDSIYEFANENKMIVGICLGMQLLFDSSEEFGFSKGLGLIPGQISKLQSDKLPNISWNRLIINQEDPLIHTLQTKDSFYFIHSFAHKEYTSKYTLAYIDYDSERYSAIVKKNNIIGCQFHPEKSAQSGLDLLQNILGNYYDQSRD